MFNLETAIGAWRRSLEGNPTFAPNDVEELERHVYDQIRGLQREGYREEEAFRLTMREMGDYAMAENEYKKVYWGKIRRERRVRDEITWRMAMLKNYLTIAWRNLIKQKGHTFINVSGLAVAIASCLLIFLYIGHERSYNQHHEHIDRIYMVGEFFQGAASFYTRGQLVPAAIQEISGVESGTRLQTSSTWVSTPTQRFQEGLMYVDSMYFDVFTVPFVAGTPEQAFRLANGVVISESIAAKYFDDQDALGQVLTIDFTDRVVTGVMQDMPATSTYRPDLLLPFSIPEGWGGRNWDNTNTPSFLLLHPNTNPNHVAEQIEALVTRNKSELDSEEHFSTFPFKDYHLLANSGGNWEEGSSFKQTMLQVLLAIGLAIVLIAAINFANLTTARALARTREIGVRKVLGAHRRQLISQFLGDALLLSYGAALVGAACAYAILPVFNMLLETSLVLDFTTQASPALLLLGISTGIGLLAGSYPAFVLSRFRPAESLRGRMQYSRRGAGVRNSLVVVQFALSIALILGTFVMWQQIQFMKDQDLNFDAEDVVIVPMSRSDFALTSQAFSERMVTIKDELRRNSRIVDVSTTQSTPGDYIAYGFTFLAEGKAERVHTRWTYVDSPYFDLFGMEVVQGRTFSPDLQSDIRTAAIINEAAVKAYGWDDPIGKTIRWQPSGDPIEVIGVVKDFHYASLEEEIYPITHFYGGPSYSQFRHLAIKISPGPVQPVIRAIEDQLRTLDPTWPFEYEFANDQFNALYADTERQTFLVGSFAGLAILVSCLGLLGLASYTTTQRTKEIGIRKVLGASVSGIVMLLSKDIARLILIAFVAAAPLGYFAMQDWLQSFHYRLDLGVGLFLITGGLAFLIAILTVSYQAIKAAIAEPVESLRYE